MGDLHKGLISGNQASQDSQSSALAAPPSGGSAAGSVSSAPSDPNWEALAQKYGWSPEMVKDLVERRASHAYSHPVHTAITPPQQGSDQLNLPGAESYQQGMRKGPG